VLLIRKIRSLLYEQGFTISGARNRLGDARDVPHDQEAAVRLSPTELHALRDELASIAAMLDASINQPAAYQAGVSASGTGESGAASAQA